MLCHTTWLISKMDPVKYIFEKPALMGRIARWQVLLSEFDIVYVTQKAIKGSALADYLAQQPLQDYRPMHPEFPDEDIMALFEEKRMHEDIDKWIACFDGAYNALGHGVGATLVSPDDQCIPFTARLGFDRTNCHTLISSGDLCLMTCDFCLVLVRCLAPIIRQFVKFLDMPENKRKY